MNGLFFLLTGASVIDSTLDSSPSTGAAISLRKPFNPASRSDHETKRANSSGVGSSLNFSLSSF